MKSEQTFREANAWELAILHRLLESTFPGKDQLAAILREVKVRTIDNEGSLQLQSHVSGTAQVVRRIPVEAEARDEDGYMIHVLLHVVDGRPTELEIYKDDGSPVKRMPDASSFLPIVL